MQDTDRVALEALRITLATYVDTARIRMRILESMLKVVDSILLGASADDVIAEFSADSEV